MATKTQRTRLLEEIEQTFKRSPLFPGVVGHEEQEVSVETLSRFRTPLVIIGTDEAIEVDGTVGDQQVIRYNLPVITTIVVNADDEDEMERLNSLEFEAKRLLYLNRRRSGYAISTDFQSRNEPIDLFEESIYKGMDLTFNVLYQENLAD